MRLHGTTWPLPALAAWITAWAAHLGLRAAGVPAGVGWVVGCLVGAAFVPLVTTRMRRLLLVAGFPLSVAASGVAADLPAWWWLLPLALLVALYPARAWTDAPLYPTPADALEGLAAAAPLPAGARLLDAGCGLGDGLKALRRQYPQARIEGVEFSRPLASCCALRCRDAKVRRGDLWADDWSQQDLVYLFQRPESMARAADKAARELKPGAWLVSLEFEATTLQPHAQLLTVPGKPVWVYRQPLKRR